MLTLVTAQPALPREAATAGGTTTVSAPRLQNIRSWGYQLQNVDPAEIARSPYDLVVIDYSRDGSEGRRLTRRDVDRMKRKPDGGQRVLLAYFSIGEAEDYRFYWRNEWVETLDVVTPPGEQAAAPAQVPPPTIAGAQPKQPPAPASRPVRVPRLNAPGWLGRENDSWSGNFPVRYWDPDWHKILFGTPQSYLERIIEAGFDGVYLDRVDVYYSIQNTRPSAEAEMVSLVTALAGHARNLRPDFIVVPQNAEELLENDSYVAVIDGIAKEDLFFGSGETGIMNDAGPIANSLRWLQPAVRAKVPVLVVEYLDAPEDVYEARRLIEEQGFVPYITQRALDRLAPQAPPPAAVPPAPPDPTSSVKPAPKR